jgi:hypothetical protein
MLEAELFNEDFNIKSKKKFDAGICCNTNMHAAELFNKSLINCAIRVKSK